MKPLSRIDRYLCRSALVASAVVLLGMLCLVVVFALVEELDDQGGAYGPAEAAWYVLLTLPRRAYEMLPYVVFLGSLVGVGRMAAQSELVVMRSAGISAYRLLGGLAWAVALAWGLGAFLGEWLAPRTEALAEAHRVRVQHGDGRVALQGGHWYREGSLFMHFEALDVNGDLLGVRQYWLSDTGELSLTREAARAAHRGTEDADERWVLYNGAETWLSQGQVVEKAFDELAWHSRIDPGLLNETVLVDPRKLSLFGLRGQIRYLEREGLDADSHLIAFWSKCLQPAATLGLVALALAFVLGPLRDVGIGLRLSAGVIAGLCFKYLQDLFAPMSVVYQLAPLLAVAAPIFLCWAVGLWGLRRTA